MTNMITVSNNVKEAKYGKIMFSDVMVTRKRNRRKWRTIDIKMLVVMIVVHLLSLFAPFTFTWRAFWTAIFMYQLYGNLGISVSYHRNLAHRSFKLPKWLEYLFAYIGVLSLQRDPIFWVSIHRFHHQYVDTEKDTHSPTFGFWFSHIGWILDSGFIVEKYKERNNVEDLKSQAFYRFLKRTYALHAFGHAALIYAIGGFTYLVWIVGVATTFGLHGSFIVNSVCHIWGNQAWNTGDLSKNNWLIALFTFGEGWHNNHHAFEFSARNGMEWWQFDSGWYIIRFLEIIGLATNVKVPTEAHKLKKSFPDSSKLK